MPAVKPRIGAGLDLSGAHRKPPYGDGSTPISLPRKALSGAVYKAAPLALWPEADGESVGQECHSLASLLRA